jgi:hypothetical protein
MKKRGLVLGIVLAIITATPLVSPILKTKSEHHKESVNTKATWQQKKANKAMAKKYAWVGYGWKDMQWRCIEYIFTKESRFDHLAKNQQGSSAFGIGQRLKERSKDPAVQILHAYKYITHRYGTPCKAMQYHLRHNHY